jgi:Mg-chelatase subunit ChlD
MIAGLVTGSIFNVHAQPFYLGNFQTRLAEAKKHLKIQIIDLIEQNRINKLGLITFNHEAKVCCGLTDDFDLIISKILTQQASGTTALYDSLKFATN